MPTFGKKSLIALGTCDSRLQKVAWGVIRVIDVSVLWGYRGEVYQNKLYRKGLSKLQFPRSKHNKVPSQAFDLAPYPIDWNDLHRFCYMAGIVLGVASQLGVRIRWGGDWDMDTELKDNKFNDLGHFELVE